MRLGCASSRAQPRQIGYEWPCVFSAISVPPFVLGHRTMLLLMAVPLEEGELAALRGPAALLQAKFLRATTLTSSPETAVLRPEHSAA